MGGFFFVFGASPVLAPRESNGTCRLAKVDHVVTTGLSFIAHAFVA